MKLKKGDKVRVTAGKDRGKEGPVEKVWLKDNKVTVTGVNMYKRHLRPRAEGQTGTITDFARPLDVAKVALLCPKCKQPTRVGYQMVKDGRVRVCRKCDQEI